MSKYRYASRFQMFIWEIERNFISIKRSVKLYFSKFTHGDCPFCGTRFTVKKVDVGKAKKYIAMDVEGI